MPHRERHGRAPVASRPDTVRNRRGSLDDLGLGERLLRDPDPCITVASVSSTAQDLIVGPNPDPTYFGFHGFFPLTDQLDRTVWVFLLPYRFDQVIGGKSIRRWIYDLSKMRTFIVDRAGSTGSDLPHDAGPEGSMTVGRPA